MTLGLPTYFLFALITATRATNDWSIPCTSGVCSYDLPASAGPSSGTVKIWGSANAISDITPAAGWQIISCSPNVTNQDIRLVCMSDDAAASGCSHLDQGAGAEGKIVRLPESCGKSAFARVARAQDPADQSIPPSLSARLVRRDGQPPRVRGLTLDTDFGAVDASKNGNVNFALQAATVPGVNGDIMIPTRGSQRRSRLPARGLLGFVGDIADSIKNLGNFNRSTTLSLPAVNRSANLLSQNTNCPPILASVTADVDVKVNVAATIGIVAYGTFVPRKMSDIAITASLTADINSTLHLIADVSGTLDSGKIKIFDSGVVPGLDFPGILTIGPSFQVNAEVKAVLDLNMDLTVGFNYQISNAQLIFPPKQGQPTNPGTFSLEDTPLKLSASPAVKATGSVEAHLIPSLNLGVSALGASIHAGVFLDLDASATMKPSLEAPTGITTVPNADSGGCFDITAELNVNAGADASFLELFDPSTQVTLFNKHFDLLKMCLGTPPSKRSLSRPTRIERLSLARRAAEIVCLPAGVGAPVAVADQTVKAAGIVAV